MFRFLSIAALAFIISAPACKKATTTVSRQEEMRGGKWKVVSGNVRYDPFVGIDTTITYQKYLDTTGQGCKADDYLVFLDNYDGEQNSAANKCSAADPDVVPFRWQLYDDDKGIYFLNANETFFAEETVKADFINYNVGRFTIRHARYFKSFADTTRFDTVTFTQTFSKF